MKKLTILGMGCAVLLALAACNKKEESAEAPAATETVEAPAAPEAAPAAPEAAPAAPEAAPAAEEAKAS
jgi:uncharacterized lipoprotein YbaY